MAFVKLKADGLRKSLARTRDAIISGAMRVVSDAANEGTRIARSTTLFQDRTHQLRDKITPSYGPQFRSFVKATAKHARFVEYGTRPHKIVARRAKALRFIWHGELVFRKSVNHPGTKPRPFMKETAATMRPIFLHNMRAMLASAAARFNN